MSSTELVDPFTAVATGQRHEAYRALARNGAVSRVFTPTGSPAWLVTGYAETRRVLTDPRLAKTTSPAAGLAKRLVPDLAGGIATHMLQCEAPDHTRLRRLVGAVFTGRRVTALGPRIEQIADGLLAAMEHAVADDPGTVLDLIQHYALPLPIRVICEMLGVPRDDEERFRAGTAVLTEGTFADEGVFADALRDQVEYVRELVARRRREPGDDLLSALVTLRQDGDRLSEDELTSMVWLLFVAGHETTVNLIASGMYALLTPPRPAPAAAGAPRADR